MTTERSSTEAFALPRSVRLAQQRLDVQEPLPLVEQAGVVDLADPARAIDQVEARRVGDVAVGPPPRPLVVAGQHPAPPITPRAQEAPAPRDRHERLRGA